MALTVRAGYAEETPSVSISDDGRSLTLPELDLADPFGGFVHRLLPKLKARLGTCPTGSQASEPSRLDLRFVRRGIVEPEEAAFRAATPSKAYRLRSPWLEVREWGPDGCRIKLVVFWNERQILKDQAILQGTVPSRQGPQVSITRDRLAEWTRAYVEASFGAVPGSGRRQAQAELADRIPSEVLWLYRNSVQSTRGPFEGYVSDGMNNLSERVEPAYEALIMALIELAFSSPGRTVAIDDIRDVPGLDAVRLRVGSIR